MLFSKHEYQGRIANARKLMAEHDCSYLLVMEPENVTYLTGFYTFGYAVSFQFALLAADGDPTVVTRVVERYWVNETSAFPATTLYWNDGEEPEEVVTRVLNELAVSGRVGIEMDSWRTSVKIVGAIGSTCPKVELVDIGLGLSRQRFVKSPAELDLMRKAGDITAQMMVTAVEGARPGRTERELTADIARTGIAAGSDMPFPGAISSGPAAREIHAVYTDRVLEADDLVFTELCAAVHNYHARFMRSIVVGNPPAGFVDLAKRLTSVQDEALATVRAGVSCTVPDRIIRAGVEATGITDHYPNKTFYGIGLLLDPNTLEPQQVDPQADFEFEAGSTWHAYLTAGGVNISEIIVITESGYDRLTTYPRDLIMA